MFINICYSPAGRSLSGKTVPEVLSAARGRRPRTVLKTDGTVFPNTDRPRLVNNIFFKELNKCLLKEPEWFRTSIYGKTLPAINWEKFWRVDSIEKRGDAN